jgi:hypothetical protein
MATPEIVAWSPGFKTVVPATMPAVPVIVKVSFAPPTVANIVPGEANPLPGTAPGRLFWGTATGVELDWRQVKVIGD